MKHNGYFTLQMIMDYGVHNTFKKVNKQLNFSKIMNFKLE